MDGYSANRDEKWIRRFIAHLVAFAALAEQTAHRSLPVRFLVLWILRRAETLMEDAVFDMTGAPPPPIGEFAAAGNAPEDALRLAARFVALAETLAALLAFAFLIDERPARRAFGSGRLSAVSGLTLRGWTPEPNDTS